MSWNEWDEKYQEALRRQQAADAEAAAQREQEEGDKERRRQVGLALARRIDAQIVKPFLRAADNRKGRSLAKAVRVQRRLLPDKTTWVWTIPVSPSNETLSISADGTWSYEYTVYDYDLYRTALKLSRTQGGLQVWEEEKGAFKKEIAAALSDQERLFASVERAVLAFMAQHRLAPR